MSTEPSVATVGIIQPRSLRERIVEVLQDAIISGEYQPGQRIVERELVERFGVSSIPVREALQDLETRGLVVKRHNRGCTVVSLTAEQERKMCEVRLLLEPTVIAWAGQKFRADRDGEAILTPLAKMEAAAEANDHPEYFRQDMALHRVLWTISGNEYAARALEPVVGSLFAMGLMRTKEAQGVDLKIEVAKHRDLVSALLRSDAEAASRILFQIADGYEKTLLGGASD